MLIEIQEHVRTLAGVVHLIPGDYVPGPVARSCDEALSARSRWLAALRPTPDRDLDQATDDLMESIAGMCAAVDEGDLGGQGAALTHMGAMTAAMATLMAAAFSTG